MIPDAVSFLHLNDPLFLFKLGWSVLVVALLLFVPALMTAPDDDDKVSDARVLWYIACIVIALAGAYVLAVSLLSWMWTSG